MREALVRAGEAVADCLAVPAWSLRGSELLDALDAAVAVQQKAAALVLGLVREVDGCGLAQDLGAAGTAAWLRHRLRLSP
ncbi:MAG TPA: HNH endonuclease, partial [Micromonosporaceae bacterium]